MMLQCSIHFNSHYQSLSSFSSGMLKQLVEKGQSIFPMLALFAGADGCAVGNHIHLPLFSVLPGIPKDHRNAWTNPVKAAWNNLNAISYQFIPLSECICSLGQTHVAGLNTRNSKTVVWSKGISKYQAGEVVETIQGTMAASNTDWVFSCYHRIRIIIIINLYSKHIKAQKSNDIV